MRKRPEVPLIRPPNEAHSVLIRVTRGCNWDKCRFCGIYSHFGQPRFEIRGVDEIKHDIDLARLIWRRHARSAFFGDADPMILRPERFAEVTRHLYATFEELERLTCYCRASTAWRRREHLRDLAAAGLSRVHVGLESGDDELLAFHEKGVTAARHIEAGQALREAGIELSHYVLLGMGGAGRSARHVRETVRVLNAVRPQFVRFRRLWIFGEEEGPRCPLFDDVQAGAFEPQTPEGTVLETRAIIAGLEFPTHIEALHSNDYVKVSGELPGDREEMLAEIDIFLALPDAARQRVYDTPSTI